MKAYSTREVAELLGLSTARVRSLLRSGVVESAADGGGRASFTFQDLVLLRTAKGLIDAKSPARRITKALQGAGERNSRPIGPFRPCASKSTATASIVRDNASTVGARVEANGPRLLHSRARRKGGAAGARLRAACAARGVDCGRSVPGGARKRADRRHGRSRRRLSQRHRADPAHVSAHINLGRLRHVGKALDEAERVVSARARARAQSPDGALQSRRRARRPRRDDGRDRGVPRSRRGSTRASPTCISTSRGSISRRGISRPRCGTSPGSGH